MLGSNAEPLFRQSDVLRYLEVDQNTASDEPVVTLGGESYLTESGLYVCLFTVNSEKAKQFRSEVI